jgi:hypothetical protein
MSYELAMDLAGATIHECKYFGSYQGDWWAKVTYNDENGWVQGSYGSCSGCDAFQSEFGYYSHSCGKDKYYDPLWRNEFRDGCKNCQDIKEKLIDFGKNYLDCVMSQEEAEEYATKNLAWDYDAKEMLDWIKENSWSK